MRKVIVLLLLALITYGLSGQSGFKLKISENRRYFTDSNGKPFLCNA